MSVPPSSESPSFVTRVMSNDAARRGVAGAVVGLLVATVLEFWNGR